MRSELKKATAAFLVLLGLVAAVPLASRGETGQQKQAIASGSQVVTLGQDRTEAAVLHQLRMLPYYSVFDNLQFKVQGDQVELFGQVVRPTLKSDAVAAAFRVEGVKHIVNNIEVLPLSNFDDRIRLAEYRAIYGSSTLNRYALQAVPPIHIIVKNGQVTLTGVVANTMDKNVAGIRANGVGGVFSVTNDLRLG